MPPVSHEPSGRPVLGSSVTRALSSLAALNHEALSVLCVLAASRGPELGSARLSRIGRS